MTQRKRWKLDVSHPEYIPNAIDTDRFSYKERAGDPEKVNVVYTGRLRHVKGIDVLLDAWSRVVASSKDSRVHQLVCMRRASRAEILSAGFGWLQAA